MLLVSFDVVSMYPNITLDHGIRAVRHKLLDRESENPSVECIIDAIKIIRTCSNIQFKGRHYTPIKGCTNGQKMHGIIPKLDIYGRYCDDTFIPGYMV